MTTVVKAFYKIWSASMAHRWKVFSVSIASGNLKVITLNKDQYHQNATYISAH